jgi:LPS sulfotransferase NodH
MLTEGLPLAKMQSGDLPAPEDFVIERYNRLHDAYFADRGLIPAGHLIDVRFEDLAADPVGTLERVYRALDLGPIDPIRPALEAERDRLRDYVQNRYRPLADATRQRLTREWRRSFETWGYDPEP